jgi:glycosyltransferase involved in cell wall biosynthesis
MKCVFVASVASDPLQWLCEALGEAGEDVTLLTSSSAAQWRAASRLGGVGRRWSQAAESVALWMRAVQRPKVRTGNEGEVWVVVTTPPWLPVLFVLTRWMYGRPVVVLVHDLLPEVLGARFGGWMASAVVKGFVWRVWGAVLGQASGVVCIGERMGEAMRGRMGERAHIAVMETGAPPDFPDPKPAQRQSAQPLRVAYVGYLGHMHDWQTLAEGLGLWLASGTDAHITIAATGFGAQRLQNALGLDTHPNVRWLGALDHDAWLETLIQTDIALVSLRAEAALASFPSKVFSAMRAGCALVAVAPLGSDLAQVIAEAKCGEVCLPGEPAQLYEVLRGLEADPVRLRTLQDAAREASQTRYAQRTLSAQWRAFLRAALPNTLTEHTP